MASLGIFGVGCFIKLALLFKLEGRGVVALLSWGSVTLY